MIHAGYLNERVNIEHRSTSVDAIGQPVESWSLLAAVWASVKKQSGLESIKADADTSSVKSSIRIRYRNGIDAGMRVIHGDDIYDIKATLENKPDAYIDLVCVRLE